MTDNYLKVILPTKDLQALSPGQFLTVEVGEYLPAPEKEGKVSGRILAAVG